MPLPIYTCYSIHKCICFISITYKNFTSRVISKNLRHRLKCGKYSITNCLIMIMTYEWVSFIACSGLSSSSYFYIFPSGFHTSWSEVVPLSALAFPFSSFCVSVAASSFSSLQFHGWNFKCFIFWCLYFVCNLILSYPVQTIEIWFIQLTVFWIFFLKISRPRHNIEIRKI